MKRSEVLLSQTPWLMIRVGNLLTGFLGESLVFLCAKERFAREKVGVSERFNYSRSFFKSDESKSLLQLFKKDQLSKERWERFALGHKKGGNL